MLDDSIWMADGKRYVAALQDVNDVCSYSDFYESDILSEVQISADKSCKKENRKVIIFDRKKSEVIFRINPEIIEEKIEKSEEPKLKKIYKSKKISRK